jgi:hypothetical protein
MPINAVQMLANQKYFESMGSNTIWLWKDKGESYTFIDGKIHPNTKQGERFIREIVSPAWANRYIIF